MRTKAIRLLTRDRQVIRDAYLHRILRRDDVLRLGHFASIPRCNFRLSQLVDAGFLRRLTCVNGLPCRQGLYSIGGSSTSVLALDLDLDVSEIDRATSVHHQGPQFVEHSLRVLDFRHRLTASCAEAGISLVRWLSEPECLHCFEFQPTPMSPWADVFIKPDAQFAVSFSGKSLEFFLEADMGHTSLQRFAEKLHRYECYLKSGAYSEAYKSPEFSLVSVTVGERRRDHLAQLPHPGFTHTVTTWRHLENSPLFDKSVLGSVLGTCLPFDQLHSTREENAK